MYPDSPADSTPPPRTRAPEKTRQRILDAATWLILREGFRAASIERVCAQAGVSKGAFFHHFADKEELGIATVEAWGAHGTSMYEKAWEDPAEDPLRQLDRMIDIMVGFTKDEHEPCVCVIGMVTQEHPAEHARLRLACSDQLNLWSGHVQHLLEAAAARHPTRPGFDAPVIARFLNSLWQGSMLVAKGTAGGQVIRDNLELARTWIHDFFPESAPSTVPGRSGRGSAPATARSASGARRRQSESR